MKKFLFFFMALICLIGCDKNRAFDQYKSLPDEWHKDSVLTFEVENLDSLQTYNLFINLRNSNAYEYNNIYLITKMNFPNGQVIKDTLEYDMAYPDGEWMGVGMNDSKTSKLWYKNGVRFAEEGTYTFNIEQAMRKNGEEKGIKKLKGITDVGLRVEKANPNNPEDRE